MPRRACNYLVGMPYHPVSDDRFCQKIDLLTQFPKVRRSLLEVLLRRWRDGLRVLLLLLQ